MKLIRAFYFKRHLVKQFPGRYEIQIDGEVKSFPTISALQASLRTFHYEYAAYTDNLCYGRIKLVQGPNKEEVDAIAKASNKGTYTIYKIRING